MVGNLVVVVQRLVEAALRGGVVQRPASGLGTLFTAEDEHGFSVRFHGLEGLERNGLVDFRRLVPGNVPHPFVLCLPERRIGNHGVILLVRRVVRGVVLRHVKVLRTEPGGPVRI